MSDGKGYIYINSSSGIGPWSNLNYNLAVYTFDKPEDVIIFSEKQTRTETVDNESRVFSGYRHYLLSKNSKDISSKFIGIYVRGESNGARYQNDSMDFISFDTSMFDIENQSFSMGGSGSNGHVYTTGQRVGYSDSTSYIPIRGTMNGLVGGSTRTVELTPNRQTNFSIGMVDVSYFYSKWYTSTPTEPRYTQYNFYNKFSSEYYKNKNKEWWNGFIDYRTFGYVNQMYSNGSNYKDSFEKMDDWEVFDGAPLFLNIHTTENFDSAIEYLNTGKIPDDDKYTDSDNGEPPIPEDSGGDDDDMDGMKNTDHADDQSILNSPTNHYYILDNQGLYNFTDWFWAGLLDQINDDYSTLGANAWNLLTGAYGDLNKYVTSLRKLNINLDTFFKRNTSNNQIILGRYSMELRCDTIIKDVNSMPLLAEYRVPMKHATSSNKPLAGNFLDYPPYTAVSIYIPFIGIVPVDGNMVVGRTIRLYGAVDVIAGTIHYNLYVQTPSKDWSLIGTYEGKCGVDIPIALDNSMQNSTNLLKMATDVTMGVCTKNPSQVFTGLGGTPFSEPVGNLSATTTNTTYFNPSKCALIMQTAIGTVPGNFGRTIGHLYCKSEELDSLSGFTVCKNVRIDDFADKNPTSEEKTEIYRLLESGVIL